MGRKRAGAAPLDPGFYGPLTLVRSFWGSFSLIRSRGYSLRYAKADLGRIFEGKYVGKHVCERRFPNRAHLPHSLPLGGRTVRGTVRSGPGEATINHRCPSAHTGANEGAIWYPTFPCRKSERLSPVAPTEFFSCPVGQPDRPLISHLRWQLPPKGKPLGCAALHEKAPQIRARRWAPKQPLYRNNVTPNAKTSEWQRAGHKRRGSRGRSPRRSFLRLSPEKAGLPPGVGRETTSQVWTCAGPNLAPLPPRQAPSILLPSYQKAGQMTTSGNGWPAGSRPGRRFLTCWKSAFWRFL